MNTVDPLTKEIIITIKPEVIDAGLNEIFKNTSGIRFDKWLDEGVGIIYSEQGFNYLAHVFHRNPPIFVQHISPINLKISLNNNEEDLKIFKQTVPQISPLLNKEKTFSVQTRFLANTERHYKKFEINDLIADLLQKQNYICDVKNPEQVISITIARQNCYIGVSKASDNLSDWAGGKHRFTKEENQISRSEFKLLEALDVFKINLPENGLAVDLGASPGGWTKVLLQYQMEVYAVDPGKIDQSVLDNPQVTYFAETTGDFLRRGFQNKFDVVVNDMRMDSKLSAQLMLEVYKILKPNGIAIMTLKLPKTGFEKRIKLALKALQQKYHILGAKQLFHNRSEITVALKRII